MQGPIFCQRHLAQPSPNEALIGVQKLPVLVAKCYCSGREALTALHMGLFLVAGIKCVIFNGDLLT